MSYLIANFSCAPIVGLLNIMVNGAYKVANETTVEYPITDDKSCIIRAPLSPETVDKSWRASYHAGRKRSGDTIFKGSLLTAFGIAAMVTAATLGTTNTYSAAFSNITEDIQEIAEIGAIVTLPLGIPTLAIGFLKRPKTVPAFESDPAP